MILLENEWKGERVLWYILAINLSSQKYTEDVDMHLAYLHT